MDRASRVELTRPGDPCLDYCLWRYAPPAPGAGKLRSVSLLYRAFAAAGADPRLYALCEALRAGIGPFRTVWGVKLAGGRLSWELYFYDYGRLERRVSIPRVLEVLAPFVSCRLGFDERRPYFMFSLDLDDALVRGERELDCINVYLGNVGSSVSSGTCYGLTAEGLTLHNLYYFFDAARQMEDIVAKIACSAHLPLPGLDLDAILWPELRRCPTIVVANKRRNEGVYFSRIDVDQLLLFLRRLEYPSDLLGFVQAERSRLDHLLYDVGVDYALGDGGIRWLKSSFYGVF